MATLGLLLFLLADLALGFVALAAAILTLAALKAVRVYASRVVRFELSILSHPSFHLKLRSLRMPLNVGESLKLVATNFKDAAGNAVDLTAFPSAVTDLSFEVDDASKADVAMVDALTAQVTAKAEGSVVVTARAKNVKGEDIAAEFRLEQVVPAPQVPVVTSFELQPVA
jgi:hypothetical protein